MNVLSQTLGSLLSFCYGMLGNYGLAIVVFTMVTKVILLPVALWTQRNSIKMVELMPEINRLKARFYGDKEAIAEGTQELYKEHKYSPFVSLVPMVVQLVLLFGVIGAVRELLGVSGSILSAVPVQAGGAAYALPALAGGSAYALGLAQNRLNPLQREQERGEQIFTNGLSIGISLALGAFVPIGVGLYWICSNLFTVAQQLLLNHLIKPAKYIDYDALVQSKNDLAEIEKLSAGISREDKKREREDYKKFFKVANKHLVFYSEKSGFYKYFQGCIEELLRRSNITIHYVTSDPQDQVFELAKQEPRLRPYYIGEKKLITLMMKMDADIVVMTVPDLDNLYLKRSYVRKDIEYIYMFHGIGSSNLLLRNKALANYDTIFCFGEYQIRELREEEQVYGLPARNLLPCGYSLLDNVMAAYGNLEQVVHDKPRILIAPSWQKDNILDTCVDELLSSLMGRGYRVILRPHPEYIKRYPQRIADLQSRWEGNWADELVIQRDFSSNSTVFESDLLITDWSTISLEFAFATKRPVLFVDTPMKIMNPEWQRLSVVPMDIAVRDQIGRRIKPSEAGTAVGVVAELLAGQEQYQAQIEQAMNSYVCRIGHSAEIASGYILEVLTGQREKYLRKK